MKTTTQASEMYAIEFRTEEQGWTRMQPKRLYTGTREEMQALLDGQLARPPFVGAAEYRMVEAV